jgi:hypothetical protein
LTACRQAQATGRASEMEAKLPAKIKEKMGLKGADKQHLETCQLFNALFKTRKLREISDE